MNHCSRFSFFVSSEGIDFPPPPPPEIDTTRHLRESRKFNSQRRLAYRTALEATPPTPRLVDDMPDATAGARCSRLLLLRITFAPDYFCSGFGSGLLLLRTVSLLMMHAA